MIKEFDLCFKLKLLLLTRVTAVKVLANSYVLIITCEGYNKIEVLVDEFKSLINF